MSLRLVHIFFILAAETLCLFFGVWSLKKYLEMKTPVYLFSIVGSFIVSFLLVFYLAWFIKKTKSSKP